MRRGTLNVAVGFLLMAGCAGAVILPSTRAPLPAAPAPAPTEGALEGRIHELVNGHRSSRRLPALQWNARIADAARDHSRAMAARRRAFGHAGFEERAAALGRIMAVRSMAENVAYDSRTGGQLASHVVESWIASADHRQKIEGAFTHTGIGVARGNDGVRYFTQIFVRGD